jgi:hypothetical protein
MKTKIFVSALFILVFSAFFLNKSVNAQDEFRFKVKVLQYLSEEPAAGVTVIIKQNGIPVFEGTTNSAGYTSCNCPNGTYDVYAYKPAPPNDNQSAQKLGHVLSVPETLKLQLGPWY